MALSCYYDDDFDYYADPDEDFSTAKQACKCSSCAKKIQPGETVLKFTCYRSPDEESEDPEDIRAIEDGDWYWMPYEALCERCAEIYMNLNAIGFQISSGDYMPALLREYQELTGFDPEKYIVK